MPFNWEETFAGQIVGDELQWSWNAKAGNYKGKNILKIARRSRLNWNSSVLPEISLSLMSQIERKGLINCTCLIYLINFCSLCTSIGKRDTFQGALFYCSQIHVLRLTYIPVEDQRIVLWLRTNQLCKELSTLDS